MDSQVYRIMQIHGGPLMHPGQYQTPKPGISVSKEQAGIELFTWLHCNFTGLQMQTREHKNKTVSFVVKLITIMTSTGQGQESVEST